MVSNFKIGDQVAVIDENLTGEVIHINKNMITIEASDGFVKTFNDYELVKKPNNQDLLYKITRENLNEFNQKSLIDNNKSNLIKNKKHKHINIALEIDLHIDQLVNSIKGLDKYDMLTIQIEAAKRKLEYAIQKKIQRVIFIHGVGEGVLKKELEYLFKKYDVDFYAASFQKYGMGATEVYIYQNKKKSDF